MIAERAETTPLGETTSDEPPQWGSDEEVDSFIGQDGCAYELRKPRPTEIRNKRGSLDSAQRNARVAMNWNNGKPKEDALDVMQAGTLAGKSNGCIRCGEDGHTWRRCS